LARARSGLDFNAERERAAATRALVVGPYVDTRKVERATAGHGEARINRRSPEARIGEAVGLARAIDLEIVASEAVNLARIRPGTFLGQGKVEEIAARVKADSIDLVIMDCAVSPVQQRNLEQAFGSKVIDRTGLILEIFGRRARTREGTLQVELAHLAYQKSRLVRSWTHLERQRGGFGFLGGPGETQIETDRRLIEERMMRIERDLASVKRTRNLHRKTRRAVPFPIVALVGYTNAGKSTLFNRLTKAGVVAEDMLFATLDPTLRAVRLPNGSKVILSDTVGFVSDLPTMLVEAFRATLEEVIEADVILHVRDIAHEDTDAQNSDVNAVLAELGIDSVANAASGAKKQRIFEVWNKVDLLERDQQIALLNAAERQPRQSRPMIVSALTGQGVDDLLVALEADFTAEHKVFDLCIEAADGRGLHWIYENSEVVARRELNDETICLTIRASPERAEAVRRKFGLDPELRDGETAISA
jgi:GTP-binding protein HflX